MQKARFGHRMICLIFSILNIYVSSRPVGNQNEKRIRLSSEKGRGWIPSSSPSNSLPNDIAPHIDDPANNRFSTSSYYQQQEPNHNPMELFSQHYLPPPQSQTWPNRHVHEVSQSVRTFNDVPRTLSAPTFQPGRDWFQAPLTPLPRSLPQNSPSDQVMIDSLVQVLSSGGPTPPYVTVSQPSSAHLLQPAAETGSTSKPHHGLTSGHLFSTVGDSRAEGSVARARQAKDDLVGPAASVLNDEARLRRYHDQLRLVKPDLLKDLDWTVPPISREDGARVRYPLRIPDEERQLINAEIFGGKLQWVHPTLFPKPTLDHMKRSALSENWVLPLKTPFQFEAYGGGGIVNTVRMTVHDGKRIRSLRDTSLNRETLYNFWGVAEGRKPGGSRVVYHFGTGYIKPEDLDEVNKYLQQLKEHIDRFSGKQLSGSLPK